VKEHSFTANFHEKDNEPGNGIKKKTKRNKIL